MSDPYTEATRNERKKIPPVAKTLLVVGGLVAVAFVTFVVVAALFLKRQFEQVMTAEFEQAAIEWQDDIDSDFFASDAVTAEAVSNAAQALFGDEAQIGESDLELTGLNLAGEGLYFDLSNMDGLGAELERLVEEAAEKGIVIEGTIGSEGSSGRLQISCANCPTGLVVTGNEGGGSLRIFGGAADVAGVLGADVADMLGADVRVDLGDEAAELPRWVPTYPRARLHKRLFSGERDGIEFGGVLHTSRTETASVYNWYEENLDAAKDGYGSTRLITKWNGRRKRGTLRAVGGHRELFVMLWENTEGNTSIVTMHKTKR